MNTIRRVTFAGDPVDESKLHKYYKRLKELHTRLGGELDRIIEAVHEDDRPPGEHEQTTPPSEAVDKELIVEGAEEHLWQQVTDALERIDAGNYGHCQICGKHISESRLDALPYTAYCIHCARQRDS